MVTLPEDYPWSSYRSNAHGKASGILVPHATYLSLSADPQRRSSIYRKMFDEVLAAQRTDEIRAHLQQQRALGDAMFQQAVASELGHAVHLTPRGRPRKADS
jgi:putative transposase